MKTGPKTTSSPGETAPARPRKIPEQRDAPSHTEFIGEPWLARPVPKSGVAGGTIFWQDGGIHLKNLP